MNVLGHSGRYSRNRPVVRLGNRGRYNRGRYNRGRYKRGRNNKGRERGRYKWDRGRDRGRCNRGRYNRDRQGQTILA